MSEEGWIFVFAAVVTAILIGVMFVEHTEWKEFSKAHNCKVVAKQRGEMFAVMGGDGKLGVGSTSDKTSYLCDDGITYTR